MDEDKLRKIIQQVDKEIEEKGITDEDEKETYYRMRMMPLGLHLAEIDTNE